MWVAVVWALLKTALIGAFVLAGVRSAMAGGPRRAVVLVVVLAVALRLAWLIAVRPQLIGDAAWYHDRAIDLATHFQYTLEGRPTARLAPGFPIALAILYAVAGASPVLGIGLNLLLSVATVLLIFRIAGRVFDERIGVTAAFITAVWPGQIPYAGVLLSEPLFGVLFLAAFLLMLDFTPGRNGLRRPLLSGLLLGAAALTRPVALLAPALAGVIAWLRDGSMRTAATATALAIIGSVLVVAPWEYRNYRAFGRWVTVTTSSGLGLWQGNHATTTMLPSDAKIEPYTELDEVERDRLAARDGKAFIAAHPLTSLRFFIGKLYRTYETDIEVTHASFEAGRPLPRALTGAYERAANSYFNVMLLLFSAFVALPFVAGGSVHGKACALVVLPVLYFASLQAVFISQYRYNYPSLPFIAVGAAVTLCRVGDRFVSRSPMGVAAREPVRTL